MTGGTRGRAQTTAKSLQLVEELHRRDGARITDLAADLDMSKSTVHNHLNTLLDCGYVRKRGDEYRLGLKFLELGGLARSRTDLFRSAEPEMRNLVEETDDLVLLATEEEGAGVLLHQIGPAPSGSDWYVGRRFPLLDTPEGEAILAHLPDDRVREAVGDDVDPTAEEFRDRLAVLRERGYATSTAGHHGDLRRVAAPVRCDDGDVLGSLCLAERSDVGVTHTEAETIELVTAAAGRVESNLERPWFGSENVVTPKHSLASYTGRPTFDVDTTGDDA